MDIIERMAERTTRRVVSRSAAFVVMTTRMPRPVPESKRVFTSRDGDGASGVPGAAGRSVDDAEETVAGIAQAGHDGALLVELLVDRGGDDGEVERGVELLLERRQTLRRAQQRHAGDVLRAALVQVLARGDEGVAGGEHRVQHEALTAREIVGQAVRVGGDLEGLVVAD